MQVVVSGIAKGDGFYEEIDEVFDIPDGLSEEEVVSITMQGVSSSTGAKSFFRSKSDARAGKDRIAVIGVVDSGQRTVQLRDPTTGRFISYKTQAERLGYEIPTRPRDPITGRFISQAQYAKSLIGQFQPSRAIIQKRESREALTSAVQSIRGKRTLTTRRS